MKVLFPVPRNTKTKCADCVICCFLAYPFLFIVRACVQNRRTQLRSPGAGGREAMGLRCAGRLLAIDRRVETSVWVLCCDCVRDEDVICVCQRAKLAFGLFCERIIFLDCGAFAWRLGVNCFCS